MISYASSLDQAGFLTHTIDDLQYLLDNDIAQKDTRDMTSIGLSYKAVKKERERILIVPDNRPKKPSQ